MRRTRGHDEFLAPRSFEDVRPHLEEHEARPTNGRARLLHVQSVRRGRTALECQAVARHHPRRQRDRRRPALRPLPTAERRVRIQGVRRHRRHDTGQRSRPLVTRFHWPISLWEARCVSLSSPYDVPPGWYPDPSGTRQWRVWTGTTWSEVTRSYGEDDAVGAPRFTASLGLVLALR